MLGTDIAEHISQTTSYHVEGQTVKNKKCNAMSRGGKKMKTEEEIKKMKTEDKSDWRCGQEWPSEEVISELRKYVTIRNGVLGAG